MRRRQLFGGLALAVSSGSVAGCDAPSRLASLPEKLRGQATFEGLPADTRMILDGSDDRLIGRVMLEALQREIAYAGREHATGQLGDADFLAISGGGENGAYGAGLLTAWSELGTRPQFKAVTGVSTGALTAPFAFLGSAYDKELERFYTTISKSDVMLSRGLISGMLGESLFDSTPLLRLIRGALTPKMVAEIGAEYEKGRILAVATTNLDVPVGVLWNIGGIAASGNPRAAELIARILLASASIPGAFPPVMIDFEEGGQRYQEMHVDGGTMTQVVLYPPSLSVNDVQAPATAEGAGIKREIVSRKRRLYVIRNSRPGAEFETVNRRTLTIVSRAISTLISSQGVGDLYRLFVLSQRDGVDFNATWIPESFTEKETEPFERGYMNRLYQVGRHAMMSGTVWHKYPPGYTPEAIGQPSARAAG